MSDKPSYCAAEYWEARLTRQYDLTGVGHIGYGLRYNNWIYRAKLNRWRQLTKGWPLTDARVLDIGCGTGFWVEPYAGRGARFTGVDISPTAISNLRQQFPNGSFVNADVSSANCPELGQFDIVNIWDVLYHIVCEEGFSNAARNIRKASKIGTRVIISDRFAGGADVRESEHVMFRTLATYERVWGTLGFRLAQHIPLYNKLSRSSVTAPRLSRRLGALHYAMDLFQVRPSRTLSVTVWQIGQ